MAHLRMRSRKKLKSMKIVDGIERFDRPIEFICAMAERFASVRGIWYAVADHSEFSFLIVFWDANNFMNTVINGHPNINWEGLADEITTALGKCWRNMKGEQVD